MNVEISIVIKIFFIVKEKINPVSMSDKVENYEDFHIKDKTSITVNMFQCHISIFS